MDKRGTAHMIEPEIYATYVLVLKHGISPQRALEMWNGADYYGGSKKSIKQVISWALEGYWGIHGFGQVSDNFTKSDSVIRFIKKYATKPSMWSRFKRIFGPS